jgi:hypothetical protein
MYILLHHRVFFIIISVLCFVLISCVTPYNFIDVFNNYPDPEQTEQFLTYLTQKYPQLAELYTLGFSTEGRPIRALHISSKKYLQSHKPALLFTSLVHSDEWITLPVVLYLAHQFVSTYDYDEDIQYIVDRASLWFIPVVNPDGYAYSRTVDRSWRKNRSRCGASSIGVDINRNFDVKWDIREGFSKDPESRFYRGSKAASEPETKALQDLASRIHFQAAADFHSFGQYILYPYGHSRTQCPDHRLFQQLARDMAQVIFTSCGSVYKPVQMCRIYPHALPAGTLMDYLYTTQHTIAFSIELPPRTEEQGGVSPCPTSIMQACEEAFSAAEFLCSWIIKKQDSYDESTYHQQSWWYVGEHPIGVQSGRKSHRQFNNF